MVTFTCNNCGDSVKKIRVEKHVSYECRRKSGGPNVCCIDCLKDFRQDYEAHTSCKTEDERYSAKGTFVAKESKNKQQKKQMTWSEIVQNVADTHKNLSQSSRDIINVIRESDNVPRKEAKFKNFCKNNAHLRRFSEKDVTAVYNLIQEEMKKNTEAAKVEKEKALLAVAAAKNKDTAETPVAKKRSLSETAEDIDESVQSKKVKSNETSEDGKEESGKEKKKKNKKTKTDYEDVDMQNGHSHSNGVDTVETSIENGEVKKKKKSKKNSLDTSTTEMDVVVTSEKKTNRIEASGDDNLTNGHSKSKKKKGKKNSLHTSTTEKDVPETSETTNESSVTNGIKASGDDNTTNGHSKSKKKKKKHSVSDVDGAKASEEVNEEQDSSTLAEEANDSSITTKSPKKKRKSTEPEKTPFKEIVAKLLKPGAELKLKSLKKMVFAVYKSGDEEVPREVRESFNKKLAKIPNVQINEKIVKLVK